MDGKIIWEDMSRKLNEMGLELVKIDYSPGHRPEITARVSDWDGETIISFKSSEDSRTRFGKETRKPIPKKVIFSGPATTILWKDGTKTTVKCSDEDVWDDNVGIAMCYLKKMLGNKGNYNNIFREAMKVAEDRYQKEELDPTLTALGHLIQSTLKGGKK